MWSSWWPPVSWAMPTPNKRSSTTSGMISRQQCFIFNFHRVHALALQSVCLLSIWVCLLLGCAWHDQAAAPPPSHLCRVVTIDSCFSCAFVFSRQLYVVRLVCIALEWHFGVIQHPATSSFIGLLPDQDPTSLPAMDMTSLPLVLFV